MSEPMTGTEDVSELEEGELYVVKKGRLERLPRNDEGGMRRVRITEAAYSAATQIGSDMRRELDGYKPDVSLVVSALVINANTQLEHTKEVIRDFVLRMFERTSFKR